MVVESGANRSDQTNTWFVWLSYVNTSILVAKKGCIGQRTAHSILPSSSRRLHLQHLAKWDHDSHAPCGCRSLHCRSACNHTLLHEPAGSPPAACLHRLSSLAMARRRCEGDKKTSDEEGLEAEPNDCLHLELNPTSSSFLQTKSDFSHRTREVAVIARSPEV